MKTLMTLGATGAIVLGLAACGDGGSSGSSMTSAEAFELCKGEVRTAINRASSSEVDMYKAGDKALEDCMRRYGFSAK